jgi:hypothetical protein
MSRADGWVPRVSEREGKTQHTGSVCLPGLRAGSFAGPKGFPEGPFLILFRFLPFLFLFSYFFISFANILQTMSNQFLIFSKIQINNPEQYQTCFLNKISFQISFMNIARRACLFT